MKYDVAIIGAGLSGLAAGIRLAYYEKRVCLLERHTTIGGLNSFYRLRGRNHDVGLHAVTNYAPKGTRTGPLSKLLRQLRIAWDDFALVPQLGSSVAFPGCTLRFANDFPAFEQEVAEKFPRQKDGFRKLVRLLDDFDEVSPDRPALSAREVVRSCLDDPLLVDMLFCPLQFYGSPTPHDMDFGQFAIMFRSVFREGFARPFGGVRPMLKVLVRKFRELGGELRLRSGVRSIRSDGARATGLVLDDGSEIEADQILSSAGSAETLALCEGLAPAAREAYAPGDISFLESIFVLDRPPAELGHRETIVFYNLAPRFTYARATEPLDLSSGIVCSPNNFAYDRPLEDGRVRITALADPDYWMQLPDDEYAAAKQEWTTRLAETAVRVVPDFRPHVVETDSFTPRTIRRFTGHEHGAVYGAPRKVLDGRTPLENLFLCGTDQGYLGIIGSMLSGISMANAHCLK